MPERQPACSSLCSPPLAAPLLAALDARQEEELVVAGGDAHPGTVGDLAGEDLVGKRILHLALDDALQGPCAVGRIIAPRGQPAPCLSVEVERDLAVVEELLQPGELDVDDPAHL